MLSETITKYKCVRECNSMRFHRVIGTIVEIASVRIIKINHPSLPHPHNRTRIFKRPGDTQNSNKAWRGLNCGQ